MATESLSQGAARLGVNIVWDATVYGTPPGVSYVVVEGRAGGKHHTDDADTLRDVETLRSILPTASIGIHAGYGG